MKKCKKIFIFSGIVICLITITLVIINSVNSDKVIYESDNANASDNRVISSNALTMMYETEAGSGEYQLSSDTTWPQEGYVFNEQLSSCESGSELTWDDENKRVLMQANTSDKCYVYFDKEPDIIYFADYIKGLYTSDGENGIYYHDSQGPYGSLEAGDNSYRYAGGDYQIAEAYQGTYNKIYDEIILLTCDGESQSISDYCGSPYFYFTLAYDTNKTQYTTMKSALEKATEDGYLTKDNIKNYVCFGSDAESCPSDNLYRIIGVFEDQVKLIKNTSIVQNYWSGSSSNTSNTWSSSTLNTETLNGTYLNELESAWMIATTNWKVGGMSRNDNATAKQYYDIEVGSGSSSTTYTDEIGLMYVSDYGYAASPDYWTTELNNYDLAIDSNWMWMGWDDEWTISRDSDSTNYAFQCSQGRVYSYNVYLFSGLNHVRPSFYLNSNVSYVSGDGSQNSPFRIQ